MKMKKMLLSAMIEKYDKTKLHFSSFDKFIFYFFKGMIPDGTITVSNGGDTDDIYEFSFDKDEEILRYYLRTMNMLSVVQL